MKSGPHLNGWTSMSRLRSAAIRASATVVFPTPLEVPATTNPRADLAIDTPHDCFRPKVVDHTYRAGVHGDTKSISQAHSQCSCQSDANHSRVRDNQHAPVRIELNDGAYFAPDASYKRIKKFSTGNRSVNKIIHPTLRQPGISSENVLP